MTTNPNGIGDAGETTGSALSLVAEPSSEALSTPQVAQRLQRSVAWVKKHGRELGGAIVNGAWTFPSVEIERRRTVTTSERFTLGGRASESPDVGRRTAAVVRMLEDGAQLSAIVRALEEPYPFLIAVRRAWIEGYRTDREDLELRCSCGAPADARLAPCPRCAARSRVLTDAQIAALADQPLPPQGTCACSGCGARVDVDRLDHVCDGCASSRLRVQVRGGAIVIALGDKVLRTCSADETQAVVASLAPRQGPTTLAAPFVAEPMPAHEPAPSPPAAEPDPAAQVLDRIEVLMRHVEKKEGRT